MVFATPRDIGCSAWVFNLTLRNVSLCWPGASASIPERGYRKRVMPHFDCTNCNV